MLLLKANNNSCDVSLRHGTIYEIDSRFLFCLQGGYILLIWGIYGRCTIDATYISIELAGMKMKSTE